MLEKYRHYFDIDPEYFPQVNEAIINNNPDIWKKYYPHETFVKLVKDTVSVLSRQQKLSIWVEGAYGTGKSHAVLTLKKLLDASDEDTREYFQRYEDQLSKDLCNRLQQLKSDEQKILTVHRYGSSNIRGDNRLVFAIQESIENAMRENGIENSGKSALKDATINWLSDEANKAYFNLLISGQYADIFSGDDVDVIIQKLKTYTGQSLMELMGKITKVAEERQFKALSLEVNGLVQWIKDIIRENNLKAIVFIWDEFTNYFENNLKALTGFQEIAEISATDPFYFIIVTHKSAGLFNDTDKDQKRILDRFVKPTCNIELPENMAFRLMGAAMEKNDDPQVKEDWEDTADELYDRTTDSRQLVKEKARITDIELKNILPIHPYTALLLKHISSAFDSNQRSMFDFIKNDRGEEIKGFQWFINNCSPEDENPLLTIDMLWDFFYEKGKEYLSHDIRAILDSFSRAATRNLNKDEARVLKTILLLQAISQRVGDNVELFIPDEKNVDNAFEGSDLDIGAAGRLAEKLVRDEVLYKKPMNGNKFQFSALVNAGDLAAVEKFKEDLRKKTTSALVGEGEVSSAIILGGALKLRYVLKYAAANDFKPTINQLRNQEGSFDNKIVAVVTFAKNDNESATITKNIQDAIKDGSYNMIFIDASTTPLGSDLWEQYIEAMANAMYQRGKDNSLANQYETNAKEVLKKWKNRIASGEFVVYTPKKPSGERITTIDLLYGQLTAINRERFKTGLETVAAVTDTMWMSNSLAAGVECGAEEKTSGQFRSANPQTKLENYIGDDAWQVKDYWSKKPNLTISKIKQCVEDAIAEAFAREGRVSIANIYDVLKMEPYGFMPCNLTAFVLGFVLKEYTDGTYSWSDGLTNDELNVLKLKEMVAEIIKHQVTPIARYKDKYIVAMTEEEKAFNKASSDIFGIQLNLCTSVEQTRERIRQKMKELSFPIWCLKYVLDKVDLKTDKKIVEDLINNYSGIANNSNFGASKTDSDIALAIGKLCMQNDSLVADLKSILTKENCTKGMDAYLHSFDNGILITLAAEVDDNGQYINSLKNKFDADAANWVWSTETAQQKIKEVILEYKIIVESNKVLPKNITFTNVIREWCDKCDYIRVSYPAAKNYMIDIAPFLEILYNIKKSGVLMESQRQKFLELLSAHREAFKNFYNNQTDLFKQVCSYYVEQFSDEEIKELYKALPSGLFIREKSEYSSLVASKVEEFKSNLSSVKLKKLWREKTGTESPQEWSKKYKMPILCMMEDKDMQTARAAFSTINKKHPDTNSLDQAISFIEKADFYDKLASKEERDRSFRINIIKSYDVMLNDVDEVKNYLDIVITADPDNWLGLPEVEKKLRQMSEAKYNQIGCDKALEKIDGMDVAEVKRYLKDLIKDNMIVGMEIIKNN